MNAHLLRQRAKFAPVSNRDKIIEVANLYKITKNLTFRQAEAMVDKLTMPSLAFRTDARARVDKLYEEFMSKYSDKTKYPEDALRLLTPSERRKERLDRLKNIRQDFAVHVSLLTQEQKRPIDELSPSERQEHVATEKKVSNKKKVKGLVQYWSGTLDVVAPNDIILRESKHQVVVKRGSKWFKHLYPLCMTDTNFAKREAVAPGYLEAILVISYKEKPKADLKAEGLDPKRTRKRASAEKGRHSASLLLSCARHHQADFQRGSQARGASRT